MDRTYFRFAEAWHALYPDTVGRGLCGRYYQAAPPDWTPPERADRIPPTAHLCQNCGRVIAAQTDQEPMSQARRDELLDDAKVWPV